MSTRARTSSRGIAIIRERCRAVKRWRRDQAASPHGGGSRSRRTSQGRVLECTAGRDARAVLPWLKSACCRIRSSAIVGRAGLGVRADRPGRFERPACGQLVRRAEGRGVAPRPQDLARAERPSRGRLARMPIAPARPVAGRSLRPSSAWPGRFLRGPYFTDHETTWRRIHHRLGRYIGGRRTTRADEWLGRWSRARDRTAWFPPRRDRRRGAIPRAWT